MVVLDHGLVVQANAVVVSATTENCVLLKRAQKRRGLARVQNTCAAGNLLDISSSQSRHAGKLLQKVQRGALGHEDRSPITANFRHAIPGSNLLAIGPEERDFD